MILSWVVYIAGSKKPYVFAVYNTWKDAFREWLTCILNGQESYVRME